MNLKIFFCFLFILVIPLVLTGCSQDSTTQDTTQEPAKYTSLAQCLTQKGVKMYGTEWCSHCKNQKSIFGDSFQYIDYVDCDKNKDECLTAGIGGYPTWIINGEQYPGEQSLERLAGLSGCELIEYKQT